jgi:hypothetical protein
MSLVFRSASDGIETAIGTHTFRAAGMRRQQIDRYLTVRLDLSAEGGLIRTPRSVRRSVGTGNDHDIAIRVSNPTLPVIWPAVTIRWVSMPRHDNLGPHFNGALYDLFKIVDLEPEQHTVSVGPVVRIAYRAVMMFHLEAMQLKHELAIRDQLFIGGASVIAPAAEQSLVPAAARFHIGHGDQRLRTHSASLP